MRPNDFELLLMRHGDADDWSEHGDEARALTARGEAAIRRAAVAFEPLGLGWSEAWSSPAVRAHKTAHAVWETHNTWYERAYGQALGLPKTHDALGVNSPVEELARFLVSRGQRFAGPRPTLAAFGHQPNLESLVSLLMVGSLEARLSIGRGDLVHLFVSAPSPFDLMLDPKEVEPLPRAVMLGFYPRTALELIAASQEP